MDDITDDLRHRLQFKCKSKRKRSKLLSIKALRKFQGLPLKKQRQILKQVSKLISEIESIK